MRRPLVALGALVAGWTMIGLPAHATYGARVTADEPQYLLTAISLGRDGDLDISDELADEAYRPFHRVDIDPQTFPLDESGRQISPHDPLLPLLLAAPMRLGGWVAAKATIALFAAALAMLTAWVAVRRYGVRPRVALGTVAAFACTSPLATYATQIYPEVPAALAVTVAVAALTGTLHRRGLAVLALAIVALPWLSIKYVPVAATLALIAVWRLRQRRIDAVVLVGALALTGAAYLLIHRAVYGGWTSYATGDFFAGSGELSVVGTHPNYAGRSRRLVGLIVDDTFGLAAWMVGWLVLPYAVGHLLGTRARNWTVVVLPLLAGWLTATFVALTMHGWWWPGRQLVVILPLGVVAIAIVASGSLVVCRILAVCAVLGAGTWLWTTIEAITRRRVLVVDFFESANPWIRAWRLALPDGRAATAADTFLLAIWTVAVIGLGLAGLSAARPANGLAGVETCR